MAPVKRLLVFLILILPRISLAEIWAHYIRSPESITAPIGDEVVFTCQTSSHVEKIVWWHRKSFHRGAPEPWTEINIPHGNFHNFTYKVTAKSTSSRLTVNFHNESLAGEYRCVSWNGASALASVAAKLNTAWIGPAPRLPNQRVIVAPGSTVFISCPPPESEPPATMIYYKMVEVNPVELLSDSDSGGLVVQAEADSSTVYTCAARNRLTEVKRTYSHRITVIAQKKPHVRPSFTNETVTRVIGKEGKSVSLICSAIGHPAPKITWRRRDGFALPHHASFSSPLILQINHLQVHDQGEYVCVAHNEMGTTEKNIRLQVWQAARIHQDKLNSDETVQEGNSTRLSCSRIFGTPRPSLYWLINGADVSNDPNIKVIDNEIEINPVEKRHAGVIQCFATNTLGSAYIPILLRVIPKQLMLQGGDDIDQEEPLPIRPNNKNNKPMNARHPSKARGNNRKVMVPPSRPNVTRLSDESVMVRWTVQHNTGLKIVFFKVQYRDLNYTADGGNGGRDFRWNTLDMNIPPHVHSYEVGGLTAGHYYKFRIAAVYSNNDNKQGPNSAKVLLQRGADLPKAPPAPIFNRTEPVSTTSIRLYWQLDSNIEISKDTPAIEGFYVHYRPTSTAGDYMKEAVEGANTRTHVLTNLTPGAQYEIKLQSFTRTVPSLFSSIIIQGTLKPQAPEKSNEINTLTSTSSGTVNGNGVDNGIDQVYIIAGCAAGGAAILVAFVIVIMMCKKRRGTSNDKHGASTGSIGRNSPAIEGLNGYLPTAPPAYSKPTITITPNPLHPEDENIDMEMSYISAQNNNCSTSPRSSTELSANIPTSCREELRKQNHIPLPARENYV